MDKYGDFLEDIKRIVFGCDKAKDRMIDIASFVISRDGLESFLEKYDLDGSRSGKVFVHLDGRLYIVVWDVYNTDVACLMVSEIDKIKDICRLFTIVD